MGIRDNPATVLDVDQATSALSVVSFHLAQRTYALPLKMVVQIIPMVKLTPLPQAHPAIVGVMNFRGEAVPVIDLRGYLGLPARAYDLHTPILLSYMGSGDDAERVDGQLVGLVVDEVDDVVSVPYQQIARLQDILPKGLGDLPSLQGLVHTSEGAMMLLDLDHLFSEGTLGSLPKGWDKPEPPLNEALPTPVLNQGEG